MRPINITSRQNPIIKTWLDIKKDRNSPYFLVEGDHLIEMAHINKALVTYISVADKNPYRAEHYQIHQSIVEKITSLKQSPGVFGICQKRDQALDLTKPIVFLDDLSDPGNLGTILRTALAFGFMNVVTSPNSVNFYNDKVLMAGQGAHFVLNLKVMDFSTLKEQVKAAGYQIVATALAKAEPLSALTHQQKLVLVIGNEARGVSKEVLAQADQIIKIAMSDKIESLNASIAASIIMHHHYQTQLE